MDRMFVLDKDKNLVETKDRVKVARMFSDAENRRVASDKFMKGDVVKGDVVEIWVSTVFLCYDHAYLPEHEPPKVFETMIFGGEYDQFCLRWSSWQEAEAGHNAIFKQLKETNRIEEFEDQL